MQNRVAGFPDRAVITEEIVQACFGELYVHTLEGRVFRRHHANRLGIAAGQGEHYPQTCRPDTDAPDFPFVHPNMPRECFDETVLAGDPCAKATWSTEARNDEGVRELRGPLHKQLAPRAGFEPATNRLTAGCSTTELPGKSAQAEPSVYQRSFRFAKL